MSRLALFSSFLCLFGLVACGSTDNSGAMPGAGGADGGALDTDVGTGAPVIKCGTVDAFKGTHNQCAAMDAESQDPSCKCLLGYKWDGAQCTGIGGCACVGFDCAGVFTTIESCQAAHANCGAPGIKCSEKDLFKGDHTTCSVMDAKGQGGCSCAMGFAWDGTACTAINGCACVGADCKSVFTDEAKCQAAHATCSPSPMIKCSEKDLFKGDHTTCSVMDAKGQGGCSCAMGFAWDGTACAAINGCECVGVDCKSVFTDEAKCQAAHAKC